MTQKINKAGTNACRILLKNKERMRLELRAKDDSSFLYDLFYENVYGILNFHINEKGEIDIASLNLNRGKLITLNTDSNLIKLCRYIYLKEKGGKNE